MHKAKRKERKHYGSLTLDQKRKIILEKLRNPKVTQEQLRLWAKSEFQLDRVPSQPTIHNILKAKSAILKPTVGDGKFKTRRPPTYPAFDTVLANWVLQKQGNKVSLTGDLIKAKGRVFLAKMGLEGKLELSDGWLQSFKHRHCFKEWKIHGERGSAERKRNGECITSNVPCILLFSCSDGALKHLHKFIFFTSHLDNHKRQQILFTLDVCMEPFVCLFLPSEHEEYKIVQYRHNFTGICLYSETINTR